MFWAKIDVLKKNKVCSGLLCKYFSHQNTHTTRMESVRKTWYQSYHCALMPILSSRVWLPMPTSFSQANDILSSSPNNLFPFSSLFPTSNFWDVWEVGLIHHDLHQISFFCEVSLDPPNFLFCTNSVLYILVFVCTMLCCIYWFTSLTSICHHLLLAPKTITGSISK